ncbi:MAG: hypothetical protein ACTHN5_12030 [Phycisphaerae bacterium]
MLNRLFDRFPLVASVALASTLAATAFAENIPPAPPTAPIGVTTPQPQLAEPATAPQAQTPQQPQATAPAQTQQNQLAPPGPKVLVIPFATLNVPEGDEWIGRGVAESVVADFGHARAFSPVAFKGQLLVEDNATAISLAHKANADYVIRGAAQRVDQTLRLTAEFIDARNGDTLAAATVTGNGKDLLKLEDDLSTQLRTSAMPIVAAVEQHQMNYIPGNYLPPPQAADNSSGSYYPGYDNQPVYTPTYTPTYVPSYQPTYYDSSYAYNGYPSYNYPYYPSAYSYPYGYGYYPSVVFFGGFGGFSRGFHGHGHDRDDHHGNGGNWNHGNNGNWNRGNWNQNNGGNWNRSVGGTLITRGSPRPITGPFGSPNVGFNRGAVPAGFNTSFRPVSGFHPVSGNVSHFGGGFSGGMRSGGFSGGGGFRAGGFSAGGMRGGAGFAGGFSGGGHR